MTDITETILESSRFWFQKVLVPIMVCIGIGGNTITVMVLTRKRMQSSTNIYLSALAIADIIYLFFVFLLSFKHFDNINDRKYELYWRFYGLSHWLCDAASSTSVWLTVSFTIERYIAVCYPMKRNIFCTENRAKTVTVIVYFFCILTTASTTFEYQLSMTDNVTSIECKIDPGKYNLTTVLSNNDSVPPPSAGVFDDSLPFRTLSDPNLTMALKNILSNCTEKHSHIIYIYPHIFNGTLKMNNTKVDHYPNMTVVHHYLSNPEKKSNENSKVTRATLELSDDVATMSENDTATATGTGRKLCNITKLLIGVEDTNLGKNEVYRSFMYWYSAIFFGLFPLVLIATFNCFLIRAVYVSQQKRRIMTNSTKSNSNREHTITSSAHSDNRITIMLISVVMMFLICQTPTAAFLIYSNLYKATSSREKNLYRTFGNVGNFLMTVNASCNFLLYSTMSKKFRTTFKKLFLERNSKSKRQTTDTLLALSSTKSNSQKFNPYHHGIIRKHTSSNNNNSKNNNNNNSNNNSNLINDEYRTPRNLETQSLTSAPRTGTLMMRQLGRAKSNDLVV